MSRLDKYPVVEQAINYGIEAMGQRTAMAIQVAYFWVEGWLAAGGDGNITEDDAKEIRDLVAGYHFSE